MKRKNGDDAKPTPGRAPRFAASAMENRATEISRRAYEKWLARGCPEGDGLCDWYEAEREVLGASAARADVGAPQPAQGGAPER